MRGDPTVAGGGSAAMRGKANGWITAMRGPVEGAWVPGLLVAWVPGLWWLRRMAYGTDEQVVDGLEMGLAQAGRLFLGVLACLARGELVGEIRDPADVAAGHP